MKKIATAALVAAIVTTTAPQAHAGGHFFSNFAEGIRNSMENFNNSRFGRAMNNVFRDSCPNCSLSAPPREPFAPPPMDEPISENDLMRMSIAEQDEYRRRNGELARQYRRLERQYEDQMRDYRASLREYHTGNSGNPYSDGSPVGD